MCRIYKKSALLILGLIILAPPASLRAEGFYECVDPTTGKTHFTTGGVPDGKWQCKGFGMRHGGFTKIKSQNPAQSADGSQPQKSASGRKGMSMVDLWKKSLKRNAGDS